MNERQKLELALIKDDLDDEYPIGDAMPMATRPAIRYLRRILNAIVLNEDEKKEEAANGRKM